MDRSVTTPLTPSATDMALAGTAIVESPERERDVLWLIERQREARGTTAGGSEQTI